jgi:transposase
MYIERIKNQRGIITVLLRQSYRQGNKVLKKTIANLTELPSKIIELIEESLKGTNFVRQDDILTSTKVQSTTPWGHVNAVLKTMNRLNIPDIIDTHPSPQRDIVLGLIAARIMSPNSKLATYTWWDSCSLAAELNLKGCKEADIYESLDWLLDRQSKIENTLFSRHVSNGDILFFDMSSTYYEGEKSSLINSKKYTNTDEEPLVKRGYSRDKKKGKTQINFALLTDQAGRPLSITVFPGNTSDAKLMLPEIDKVKNEFSLSRAIMVGDRGMISSKDIKVMKEMDGIDWISALRSVSIKNLLEKKLIHIESPDNYELLEFSDPENYPGERLIACLNPDLRLKRKHKRQSLIDATIKELQTIKTRVDSGKLSAERDIALAVGKIINKHKMKKHFELLIKDGSFEFKIKTHEIEKESDTDGLYVIRTSVPIEVMSIDECVEQYKNLAKVESAFRTMKNYDLRVRPIYHFLDNRIRAHLFLIMLSYYVEWHMRQAWIPITFSDPDRKRILPGNPVAPTEKSETAKRKSSSKMTDDGLRVQRFRGVLDALANISEVELSFKTPKSGEEIKLISQPEFTPLQQRALDLIDTVPKY